MNNNNNKFKNVMTRIGCGTLALLSTSSLSCGMKKNNSTNTNSQENNALTTETIIDNSEDNNVETLTPVKEKTVDISYIPIVMYPERKTKGDMIGEIDIYSSIIDKLQKDMEGSKTETGETKKMAIKFMVPSSWYYKMLRYSDNLGYHHYMFCEGYQGYIEYNTNYPFMVGYEYKKHEMEKISPKLRIWQFRMHWYGFKKFPTT